MVDSNWTGKDHSSRGNCYSDWTVQKGRAQSHCHELHPSDAKNHFVLEQKVAKYYLQALKKFTFKHENLSKVYFHQFLADMIFQNGHTL